MIVKVFVEDGDGEVILNKFVGFGKKVMVFFVGGDVICLWWL